MLPYIPMGYNFRSMFPQGAQAINPMAQGAPPQSPQGMPNSSMPPLSWMSAFAPNSGWYGGNIGQNPLIKNFPFMGANPNGMGSQGVAPPVVPPIVPQGNPGGAFGSGSHERPR